MVVDSISNMKIGESAGPSGLPAEKKKSARGAAIKTITGLLCKLLGTTISC